MKAKQDKMIKLQTSDSSYFGGKGHFVDDDGTQSYLVFQPMYRHFKMFLMLNVSHHGNLKDSLMKILNILIHLIIVLLQH